MMGGVELALAGCTSVAGAVVQQQDAPQPTLPRTGADGPNALALGATVGLAGLGLTLVRRSRTSI
jgi:LPXTG-motif cell wall-anchored protein